MKQINRRKQALLRAFASISALLVVVGGVTFAALQSQKAVVKGNSIQTAVASLQLSNDGTTYSSSVSGYAFSNLIPGGNPSPNTGYPIYLKNAGSTPLSLSLAVAPTMTNLDNVDLSKVFVLLTPIDGGAAQKFSMQDLAGTTQAGVTLTQYGHLFAGQTQGFRMQVQMDSDATFGSGASLSNIDFHFGANATS